MSSLGTDEERVIINKRPYEISLFHSGRHKGLVRIEKKNGRYRYKNEPIIWLREEELLKQYACQN